MAEVIEIDGHEIHLADPDPIPKCAFKGRAAELDLCRAAWGISQGPQFEFIDGARPLNFRLQGPPGCGKNELAYQLARDLKMDLYIVPGHEEFSPEDLALVLVPESRPSRRGSVPLVLRASPLATALYRGGLVFFDEMNRVPERALSPLASVLDGRLSLSSALTSLKIRPNPEDPKAGARFRFCCALNPALSADGRVLPEYIEQRTLPVIEVTPMGLDELLLVLRENVGASRAFESAFRKWYQTRDNTRAVSIRQAQTLVVYAGRYRERYRCTPYEAITTVAPTVVV